MYAAVPRITPRIVIAGEVIVGEFARFADADLALTRSDRFRQAEVQHLDRAIGSQLDVRGLEIAMDDPLLVCRFERFGNLLRDGQRLVERDRAARDALRQVVALDQLHHDRAHTAAFFEAVDVRDVRVIEGRERLRFAREPREPVGVTGERVGQYLERDIAIELRIARAVDLAHPAGADAGDDFVDAEARAGSERQTAGSIAVSVARTRSILRDAAVAPDGQGYSHGLRGCHS